jgi:hypothetical protein
MKNVLANGGTVVNRTAAGSVLHGNYRLPQPAKSH